MKQQENIQWELIHFDDLIANKLYKILQLRSAVFVIEQQCIYGDADNKDQESYHLCGWNAANQLLAYARILPKTLSFKEASIGRVCTDPLHRKIGLGIELMQTAISHLYKLYGSVPIRIGAQYYLVDFYKSFGFEPSGAQYLEEGIVHIEMILTV